MGEKEEIKTSIVIKRVGLNRFKIQGIHEQVVDGLKLDLRYSQIAADIQKNKMLREAHQKFLDADETGKIKILLNIEGNEAKSKAKIEGLTKDITGMEKEKEQILKLNEVIKKDLKEVMKLKEEKLKEEQEKDAKIQDNAGEQKTTKQ